MGLASILLGILAIIVAIGGIVATPIYILGSVLSFGAPIIGLVGIILGGVSYSRAKNDGGEVGLPIAGIIVSVIGFFIGLLVAVTCGMCNSMCTSRAMTAGPRPADPRIVWDGGEAQLVDPFEVPSPVVAPPIDDPSAPPPAFPAPPASDEGETPPPPVDDAVEPEGAPPPSDPAPPPP